MGPVSSELKCTSMSMSIQRKLLACSGVVMLVLLATAAGVALGAMSRLNGNVSRPGARDLRAVNAIGRSAPTVRRGERERTTPFGTVDGSGRGSGQ
jgi:hypothetical protein